MPRLPTRSDERCRPPPPTRAWRASSRISSSNSPTKSHRRCVPGSLIGGRSRGPVLQRRAEGRDPRDGGREGAGAAPILRSMREQEVAEIMSEVARLHHLELHEIEEVMGEFHDTFTTGPRRPGRVPNRTRAARVELGGNKADEILDNLGVTMVAAPFEFLRCADTRQVLSSCSRTSTRRRSPLCWRTCIRDAAAMSRLAAGRAALMSRSASRLWTGRRRTSSSRSRDPRAQAVDGDPAVGLLGGRRAPDTGRHPQLGPTGRPSA